MIDVLGVNSYFGWYGTIPTFGIEDKLPAEDGKVCIREADVSPLGDLIARTLESTPDDMPLLLTEFGADSIPKYYSQACELWSENYHAKVVSAVIGLSRDFSEVAGTFVFAFTDYSDPSKPLNGRWNGLNLKGMLTRERDRKLPFYALRDAYAGE